MAYFSSNKLLKYSLPVLVMQWLSMVSAVTFYVNELVHMHVGLSLDPAWHFVCQLGYAAGTASICHMMTV